MNSFFRDIIDRMEGYVPGEQPKGGRLIKLNTNENPYPPAPGVESFLKSFDFTKLRLYPDPLGDELRDAIAELYGLRRENVLIGNGSDDILTIVTRSFAGEGDEVAFFDPTYSLYSVLAEIQGAKCRKVPLTPDFSMPDNFAQTVDGAKLFYFCRPNAPTGNAFPKKEVEAFVREFRGVVLIDEAYADFADDNCVDLVDRFDNVIVSRTVSKSYSLAGVRLGVALASQALIDGMMKVKDSYNVNMLTQGVVLAAFKDQDYFSETRRKIIESRAFLMRELEKLEFKVIPSSTNFVFASPPSGDGEEFFKFLRANDIVVRYFSADSTKNFVRITIGLQQDMEVLIEKAKLFVAL